MKQIFFASYARENNRDQRLGTVVDALAQRVGDRLAVKPEEVAFFDVADIKTGQDWEDRLGEALRHIRVLVCLFSPWYLARPYCAKEFEVFRRRVEKTGAAMKGKIAIVPVIWDPVPTGRLPKALAAFQYSDQRLPAVYASDGLRALSVLKSQADRYEETIAVLAEVIGQAYEESVLSSWAEPVRFGDLPQSIHNPGEGPYSATLIVLHPEGSAWRPEPTRPTVGVVFDGVVAAMRTGWEEIPADLTLRSQLEAAAAARRASVVLVAEEQSRQSPWQEMLASLSAAPLPATAVVVGYERPAEGSMPPPVTLDTQATALAGAGFGAAGWFDLQDSRSLEAALTRALTAVRMALIAEDPGRRAEDPGLVQAARAEQGLTLDTAPVLTSPAREVP
jgi:hypothetical protein